MNFKLQKICHESGLSCDNYQVRGFAQDLENLIKTIIEECAIAAELHSRSYSDSDAGSGAKGAAGAVRHYGSTLLDK